MFPYLLSARTSLSRFFFNPLVRAMSTGSIFGDNCPLVVSPAQLRSLAPSSVSVFDASWHMPGSPRSARDEFIAQRVPNAQFLDLDEVASPHELGLKHMMPSPEVFAEACENFGITPESHVVIYDTHGVFSSPRALFMFRAFGHSRSSILDGGLPAWIVHGCPTESGVPAPVRKSTYPVPKLDTRVVKSYQQVVSNAQVNPALEPIADIVLDARSHGRYLGTDPEPRPGLSSGHIPHSFSLPFSSFLQTNPLPKPPPSTSFPTSTSPSSPSPPLPELPKTYTTVLPPSILHTALLDALGSERATEVLQGKRGVVASCGSGMTAGVLWLGLSLLGVEGAGVYDESWTGYAMRKESKIVKSE
ncbi:hypothetical protein AcV7_000430 [Taiwanofungus camphoratus]|nr:hypothetical protein AcW2_001092 [Antrodia cinnamomea]KAI0961294.1 hypothetical protein AcV7_000430 [Antrodia cinnamomea]